MTNKELEYWIKDMRVAMVKADADKIAYLCDTVDHRNCPDFCPFVNICDWLEDFTGQIPCEFLEED